MTACIELALNEDTAVISPIGASLRSYTTAGRLVVVPMGAFDGAVLAPWPNRIADGRYRFAGEDRQLPITEPDRGTALHGLVAGSEWEIAERTATSASLDTVIAESAGYPHTVALSVRYELTVGGLVIRASARNLGTGPAPFGFGFHPWFHPGGERVDDAALRVPAGTWFETDERLIPTEVRPFDDGSLIPADHVRDDSACIVCKDFRALRTIGGTVLDDAFGSPSRSADDRARLGGDERSRADSDREATRDDGDREATRDDGDRQAAGAAAESCRDAGDGLRHGAGSWSYARLRGADDGEIVIGMDESFRAWQACTGDGLDADLARRAIAIEPMTCAPNAFAAGEGYDVIAPGAEFAVEWSIALV